MPPPLNLKQLAQRLDDLQARLSSIEAKIASHDSLLSGLTSQLEGPAQPVDQGSGGPRQAAEREPKQVPVTPGIARVLKLVHGGKSGEAQQELRKLATEELAAQPGVVALVAAVLCIERGDFEAGLTALNRARQFSDDPKLQRVIELVRKQAGQ